MLTFTDKIHLDLPITDIQILLDSLSKFSSFGSDSPNGRIDFSEITLPKDLKESRTHAKKILVRNSIEPTPVVEGSRRQSLISALAKIYQAGASREDLEEIANQVNDTLFYNMDRELAGLPPNEVAEVVGYVLKLDVKRSTDETLVKLGEIEHFLKSIKPLVKRDRDSAWKLLMGLIEQGAKYGYLIEEDVVVECSWLTLAEKSKVRSQETISKSLKSLHSEGVIDYSSFYKNKSLEKQSSNFTIKTRELFTGTYFGLDEGVVENIVNCRKVITTYLRLLLPTFPFLHLHMFSGEMDWEMQ